MFNLDIEPRRRDIKLETRILILEIQKSYIGIHITNDQLFEINNKIIFYKALNIIILHMKHIYRIGEIRQCLEEFEKWNYFHILSNADNFFSQLCNKSNSIL